MGGEKLSIRKGVFTAALLFAAGLHLIFTSNPLSAQEIEMSGEPSASGEAGVTNETGASTEAAPLYPGQEEIILDDPVQSSQEPQTTSGWIVFRMVLVLALSALAIYGVVFFVKRLSKPKQIRDPHLKILASTPLGNNSFAAVISVGSKAWLVGGGDSGISLIAEIDEQEPLESMLIDDAARDANANAGLFPDFRSLLRKFMKGSAPPPGANPLSTHAENLRRQRDRLGGP